MTRHFAPRTATLLGLAALAVATVVTGCQSDHDPAPRASHVSRTPTPISTTSPESPAADTLPLGAAPRIPYIVYDKLYLGNKAQHGSYLDVQFGGKSVVAFRPGRGDDAVPVIFRNGRRVDALRDAIGMARLSPDGTKLAWFEVSGGTDHLVLRDLTSGTDVARVAVDARSVNQDDYGKVVPHSVTNSGTVVYTIDAKRYFSWRPGTTPAPVPAPPIRRAPKGFARDASFVTLNQAGSWAVWVTDRLGHNPESPASNGITDGATFERRGDPQSRFTVTFPNDGGAYKLMWESNTDALLDFLIDGEGSADRYLRCSVITQRCEYAPTPANPTLPAAD